MRRQSTQPTKDGAEHTLSGRAAQRVRRPRRPWTVTANALLLLLEAAGFMGASGLFLGPLGTHWLVTPRDWGPSWDASRAAVAAGLVFGLLAVLALAAAVGLLRLSHGAWLTAVMLQGVELLIALVLYFGRRPAYAYVMMLYGVFMVLYLHQAEVQAAFRSDTDPGSTPAVEAHPR